MKIGVFDSGIGGKSIADHLKAVYPDAEIIYVDDRKNVPYGNRTNEEVVALTDAAIQPLLHSQCDVTVLACTHYHWIKEQITELSQGCALVIDPSDAIARQVGVVLGDRQIK